jgi:hypothetical protein
MRGLVRMAIWGGVIGGDGMGEIEIGDLGMGHAFDRLQLDSRTEKPRCYHLQFAAGVSGKAAFPGTSRHDSAAGRYRHLCS